MIVLDTVEAFRAWQVEHRAKWYETNPPPPIPLIEQREFMTVREGRGVTRHVPFRSDADFRESLVRLPPVEVFRSVARYERPQVPWMEQKGWLGSEFIMDFDYDHDPDDAMFSDMAGEDASSWEQCVDQTARGIDGAEDKLGITPSLITFSGNRGFHVYYDDDFMLMLDGKMRDQVVDVIKALGITMLDEPVARDVAREARVPGSFHRKGLVCTPTGKPEGFRRNDARAYLGELVQLPDGSVCRDGAAMEWQPQR